MSISFGFSAFPWEPQAERHFVACKKPLPLGEPRACEMEGYEACEAWVGILIVNGELLAFPTQQQLWKVYWID